jgi:hypothetical protein
MADLTPEQLAAIADIRRRGAALLAIYNRLGAEQTPATSSGQVNDPHWLQLARDQLRLSVMAGVRAIEQPEGL